MTDFQVTIVTQSSTQKPDDNGFAVTPQTGAGDKVIESIEKLGSVWDKVIDKLSELATNSVPSNTLKGYELSEIEFNIGIEAGLNVGLVTKGDASVSITFSKVKSSD